MADTKPKESKEKSDKASGDSPSGSGRARAKLVNNPHPVEEVYVDGIAGILGRANVCKLDCYNVVGIDREDNNTEIRRVTHRLVMPTNALPELIQMIKTLTETAESK